MCWCCASLVYIFAGWSTVVAPREGVVLRGCVCFGCGGQTQSNGGKRRRRRKRFEGQRARVSQHCAAKVRRRFH